MNQIDLNGHVAIVTGGAQGIGQSIVERFAASGATVEIWDLDGELAQETASGWFCFSGTTPSFFCRLVEEVVYWKVSFFSGKT